MVIFAKTKTNEQNQNQKQKTKTKQNKQKQNKTKTKTKQNKTKQTKKTKQNKTKQNKNKKTKKQKNKKKKRPTDRPYDPTWQVRPLVKQGFFRGLMGHRVVPYHPGSRYSYFLLLICPCLLDYLKSILARWKI